MIKRATNKKLTVYESVTKIGTRVVFNSIDPLRAPGLRECIMVNSDIVSLVLIRDARVCGEVIKDCVTVVLRNPFE